MTIKICKKMKYLIVLTERFSRILINRFRFNEVSILINNNDF